MKIYKQSSNFEKEKSLAQQRHRPEFLARNEAFLVRFFSRQSIARATFRHATYLQHPCKQIYYTVTWNIKRPAWKGVRIWSCYSIQ